MNMVDVEMADRRRIDAPSPPPQRTLLDAFRDGVRETPGKTLLHFVGDDGAIQESLTYAQLSAAGNDIAAYLQGHCGLERGARAMLVYPPSLDFVRAFLGCLVAGIIPVPVSPPDPFGRDLAAFRSILASCGASAVLSNAQYMRAKRLGAARRLVFRDTHDWPQIPWHRTDNAPPEGAGLPPQPWAPQPDDIAFLQYTSGSTFVPKGVMITYANLEHQLEANAATLDFNGDVRAVFWVPHYHDLGLISGILSCIRGNGELYLMSPLTFLRNPSAWPALMSRVRATHTAAPNFAYELVVRKTTPGQRARWDLSTIRAALNGGEPIREATLRQFAQAFAVSGFRPEAHNPVYGLAEHTVDVTAWGGTCVRLSRHALEQGRVELQGEQQQALNDRAITLVSSGKPIPGVRVRIVDPQSGEICLADRVGEIWVDSPSKAAGYYRLDQESAATFEAKIAGDPDQVSYLRTGDLGFLLNGELCIAGRLKDIIIIRGRNYYAEDIEESVRKAHDRIRRGGVVAFPVTEGFDDGPRADERIVVVVEISADRLTREEAGEIARAIVHSVWTDHSQVCRTVVVGKDGIVPKTSSGKVQRQACRSRFLSGELTRADRVWHVERFDPEQAPVAQSVNVTSSVKADAPSAHTGSSPKERGSFLGWLMSRLLAAPPSRERHVLGASPARPPVLTVEVVRRYLMELIANKAGLSAAQLDPTAPLGIYSIDSLAQAQIYAEVSSWLGWNVESSVILQHPTIDDIARYIADHDTQLRHTAGSEDRSC